jgi:hypothetical protein
MTDKQLHFVIWLITKITDQCQTMEEVRQINKEIRCHMEGLIDELPEEKNKAVVIEKRLVPGGRTIGKNTIGIIDVGRKSFRATTLRRPS